MLSDFGSHDVITCCTFLQKIYNMLGLPETWNPLQPGTKT